MESGVMTQARKIAGYIIVDIGDKAWKRMWFIQLAIWSFIGLLFLGVSWFSVMMETAPPRLLWIMGLYVVFLTVIEPARAIYTRRKQRQRAQEMQQEAIKLGYRVLLATGWCRWPATASIKKALELEHVDGHAVLEQHQIVVLVGEWLEPPELKCEEYFAEPEIIKPFPAPPLFALIAFFGIPWLISALRLYLGIQHPLLSLVGYSFWYSQWIAASVFGVYALVWCIRGGRCWRLIPGRVQFGRPRWMSGDYHFDDFPVEAGSIFVIK